MAKPQSNPRVPGHDALSVRNKAQVNIRIDPRLKDWTGRLRDWAIQDSDRCLWASPSERIQFSDKDLTSESAFVSRLFASYAGKIYRHMVVQVEKNAVVADMIAGCLDAQALRDKSKLRGVWPWLDESGDVIALDDDESMYWRSILLVEAIRIYEAVSGGVPSVEDADALKNRIALLENENKELRDILEKIVSMAPKDLA